MRCACGHTRAATKLSGIFRRADGYPAGYAFEILVCEGCGLARTNPPPSSTQYAAGKAHSSRRAVVSDSYSAGLAAEAARIAPGGRLLDVGCSTGEVVAHALAIGMDAEGIDADPAPVAAGAALGRPLRVAGLADLDGRYDVILMNHTLEHVHVPVAFLAAAAERLAPSGALLVNVPNHRSPVAVLMRDQWIGWLPTEHVFHYSRSTLADVAAQAGLRIAESATAGVIEPPSVGVKGVLKKAVTLAVRRAGRGDELECVLRHAT